MNVGLHLKDMPIATLRSIARMAEEAGCTHLFFPELSITSTGPVTGRDPFISSSVALEQTRTLRAGTGVVGTIFHTAHHLALTAATLGEQSAGRFVLGVGVAHREFAEHLSVPFPSSVVKHARDVCTSLRAFASGGVQFGAGFDVWLAALGPHMVQAALDTADGVMLNWLAPESIRPIAVEAQVLTRQWSLTTMVRVGQRAALEHDAKRYRSMFANYAAHFARQGLDSARAVVDATCLPLEELDRLNDVYASFADAGTDLLILNPSGMDRSAIEALLEAIAGRQGR